MKTFSYLLFACLLLLTISSQATTLQDVYMNASPGMGYDKLLSLQPGSVYTGGLSISDKAVAIQGHGAIIDLSGGSITVQGNSVIDLDGCIIINGSSAVHMVDNVSSHISQCTFYGNQIGIHFMSTNGKIEVYNTILAFNSQYGFACEEASSRHLSYIDAYQNAMGNYMEWCPG